MLLLVSLDVSIIFADFLISLYTCDHSCGKDENADEEWRDAQDALGVVSLVFSCLFMFELLASIWAFGLPYVCLTCESATANGLHSYFKSKFHCFDAFVIVAGFIIDVCLKGLLEEIGSIVVVLRLWRVFKIIEEFSAGAADQMDKLTERIEHLESENDELKKELASIMGPNGSNETDEGTGKPSDRSSE